VGVGVRVGMAVHPTLMAEKAETAEMAEMAESVLQQFCSLLNPVAAASEAVLGLLGLLGLHCIASHSHSSTNCEVKSCCSCPCRRGRRLAPPKSTLE
jgi:hypothetical protein